MAAGPSFPATVTAFEQMFATDADCATFLVNLRWPQGYACTRCGCTKTWMTSDRRLVCSKCRHKQSIVADTLMARTHYPLKTWFLVAWCVCEQKNGVSALGLQRAIGFGSYHTAWQWLHRMRRAMVLPGRNKLNGEVEVDETFIGGVKTGKRGRGAAGKALVLMAVEVRALKTTKRGRAVGRIRLLVIPNATAVTLLPAVAELVDMGSNVVTDGLSSYTGLQKAGFNHTVSRANTALVGVDPLPKCHRVASLLKRWLLGTHQGSVDHAFLQFYLDEFVFRFNRRTSGSHLTKSHRRTFGNRGLIFRRLLEQAVAHPPIKKRNLIASAIIP